MSSPVRVAVVAEGTTDHVVLEQIVAAHFGEREIEYSALQPELSAAFAAMSSEYGFGWGGVYRWARQIRDEGGGSISGSFALQFFDLLIVHVDCDVAHASYADISISVTPNDLPCALPCPPALATIERLETVVLNWLGVETVPPTLVFCIPAQAMEGWILFALYEDDPATVACQTDCLRDPASRLATKTVSGRLVSGKKKKPDVYKLRAPEIAAKWPDVVRGCDSAARFEAALSRISDVLST